VGECGLAQVCSATAADESFGLPWFPRGGDDMVADDGTLSAFLRMFLGHRLPILFNPADDDDDDENGGQSDDDDDESYDDGEGSED
jgi:hypothetical protein